MAIFNSYVKLPEGNLTHVGKTIINHPWLGMVYTVYYTTYKNGDDWGWFMAMFYPLNSSWG